MRYTRDSDQLSIATRMMAVKGCHPANMKTYHECIQPNNAQEGAENTTSRFPSDFLLAPMQLYHGIQASAKPMSRHGHQPSRKRPLDRDNQTITMPVSIRATTLGVSQRVRPHFLAV